MDTDTRTKKNIYPNSLFNYYTYRIFFWLQLTWPHADCVGKKVIPRYPRWITFKNNTYFIAFMLENWQKWLSGKSGKKGIVGVHIWSIKSWKKREREREIKADGKSTTFHPNLLKPGWVYCMAKKQNYDRHLTHMCSD